MSEFQGPTIPRLPGCTDAEWQLICRLEPSTFAAYMRYRNSLPDNIVERVYVTGRSVAQQRAKFAAGLSANENASWHTLKQPRALDRWLRWIDGDWDKDGRDIPLYRTANLLAEKEQFRQISFNPDGTQRFIKTPKGKVSDLGHLEFRGNYKTLADAIAAEGLA